jgi:hypothetical protein
MSEYLKDSRHNDMRTCDDCGGAFYASRGPSEEEEDWTCDTCENKDAEIARLRAALKPFAEFARAFYANPMRGVDDALYSIHGGAEAPSGKGAELRLSACRAALDETLESPAGEAP